MHPAQMWAAQDLSVALNVLGQDPLSSSREPLDADSGVQRHLHHLFMPLCPDADPLLSILRHGFSEA